MKFSCYKDDLNEAMLILIKAVAVKPMTPILAGIYLKAENSALELQANNFSTGIIIRIPANVESSGEVVVSSGKRFQEFVRNMPDDTVTFSNEEGGTVLVIESGGASVELMTMEVSDFPKVKTPETARTFKILKRELGDLIRKTVFAAAKDESRPVFTGALFEVKGDKISIVATNTHRLAFASKKLPENYTDVSFVVPAETLRGLITKNSSDATENFVTVNCSLRYVTFTFDNVFVNSRLIEGLFPPYDKVIPESTVTHVMVDTAEFKRAVDFVALMSKDDEYNTVKFVFEGDGIAISANSGEFGNAVRKIAAEIDGERLSISFNADYIADVLRVIDTKQTKIDLNDKFSPATFTEPGNDDFIYVATPVRA
ncbi:MAG: DNA polymerase III subunit beta [Selenomonadaceae bacterium]|nr:DNA polymerase III subunit beta [Selenomonadaceae bacterium]